VTKIEAMAIDIDESSVSHTPASDAAPSGSREPSVLAEPPKTGSTADTATPDADNSSSDMDSDVVLLRVVKTVAKSPAGDGGFTADEEDWFRKGDDMERPVRPETFNDLDEDQEQHSFWGRLLRAPI
jgi:hypothetical protein